MRKTLKRLAILFCLISLLFTVLPTAFAGVSDKNAKTGFSALVIDDASLLSKEEEYALLQEMLPITEYANIAVYTVSTPTDLLDYERAREKRIELFGSTDSAVLMVDMYLRRVVIQRKGEMEHIFNNAKANNITNNMSHYLTKEDYYEGCLMGITQMISVINGEKVPSPMQKAGNACIAVFIGLLGAFVIAVSTSSTYRNRMESEKAPPDCKLFKVANGRNVVLSYTKKKKFSDSDFGCDGSSCGGSSCGGSSF